MKNYKFTENWFTDDGLLVLKNLDVTKELHILEIGSFEGKSTVWFLDNILKNKNSTITCVDPWMNYSQDQDSLNSYFKEENEWDLNERKTKEIFLHNIVESGDSGKVIIRQGFSDKVLPSLITEQKTYDIIFIDGNHTAPYVMMDSVMSWSLLKKGGIMIFDDYAWGLYKPTTLRPKESVDYFMLSFSDYIEEIYCNDQRVIKKIK
jgi:predicted O-methyltransferase YrrM